MVNDRELARLVARAIFESPVGIPENERVQRIALKGGKYPGRETDLGGLCEDALTDVIERALVEHRSY